MSMHVVFCQEQVKVGRMSPLTLLNFNRLFTAQSVISYLYVTIKSQLNLLQSFASLIREALEVLDGLHIAAY